MFSIIELISFIILLLLVSTLTLVVSKKLTLPFSLALIFAGMILAKFYPLSLNLFSREWLPDVVLFIFLPTLIFEAAFKLPARPLRHTLFPLLIVGVGGSLLFALLMGLLLKLLIPSFTLPETLLLGVIISATDHSLIATLLKRLDAPKRLIVLTEGESLFNNATAIVAANILFSLVVISNFPLDTAWQEWETFVWQLFGGILIGWLTALLTGSVLKYLKNLVFAQISTTIICVYGTFLIAEEWLQVSGIMAILAAGLTLSRFSTIFEATHNNYLTQFWEYLAHLTYTLIFLMTGLNFNLTSFTQIVWQLGLVILTMLLCRPLITHLLLTLISLFPSQTNLPWRYRPILYWGSLRGATALAILFNLGDFNQANSFLAIITGVVLFTVLTMTISLPSLIHWLKLDQLSPLNKLLRLEGLLKAQQRAFDRIPEFQQGGLYSARIAHQEHQRCQNAIQETQQRLQTLREQEITQEEEYRLLFIQAFAWEKNLYQEMFIKGHLSERAYRNLIYSIEVQSEAIRQEGQLPKFTLHFQHPYPLLFSWILTRLPGEQRWANYLQTRHTIRDYEEAWGRYQGNIHVLSHLDEIAQQPTLHPQLVEKIRSQYRRWHDSARARIDKTTEQFFEFVTTVQENLAERLILHAQRETIVEQTHRGFLPEGVAHHLIEELEEQIQQQEATLYASVPVSVEPAQLLRKIPIFKDLPAEESIHKIVPYLQLKTLMSHEIIVKQGELKSSLFFLAQGVIRVSHREGKTDKDIATLMAGDFFGEEVFLSNLAYPATYRAVTSCLIYELRREDFLAYKTEKEEISRRLQRR